MKFKRRHQFQCDAPSAVALAGVMFSVLIPWSQKWVFHVGETHFQGNDLESGLDLHRTVGAAKIFQGKLRATFAILSSFLSAKSG